MKTLALAIATTALTATVASAAGIGAVDQNGDRFASKSEIVAVYPTLSNSDFRALDANRDNRVSASEITAPGATAILNKHVAGVAVQGVGDIDANGDGFASASELAAAYPGFRASDFDDIDTNDDGRVSSTEIYAPVAQQVVTRYEAGSNILVSLDRVDTDGSGFASYGELAAQYPGLSTVDFQRFDTNNDNRISFSELYDLDAIEILGKNL
jgi:Ca2+-binding EF-hand superfamily protein